LIEPEVLIARDRGSTFVVVSMEEGQMTMPSWNNTEQQSYLSSPRQAISLFIAATNTSQNFRTVIEQIIQLQKLWMTNSSLFLR
jgi:hypothetical protein